jgi:hypothetical protein
MTSLALSLSAEAAKDYKKIANCGSASVVSGDSCENIKVEFKFDGCELKSEAQAAKKILCEKKTVKARFQDGNYRYEAEFKKEEDNWGGNSWQQIGAVSQYEKVEKQKEKAKEKPKAEAKSEVKVAPAEKAPVAAAKEAEAPAATPSASPFKFSAFFDARYTQFTVHNDPKTANANAESGFGLEDGALYANYDKDKFSVVLDLAFRRAKDSDTNSSATVANQSSNNNISIGSDKSQLYARYKVTPELIADLGQFDTLFGVEVNDSKDRVFGKSGLVYDLILPLTHTGFMLEYARNGASIKVFGADPNNKGTNGSSATGDNKTEFGGAIAYSNDNVRGQFGYMTRSILKANPALGYGDRTLLDATAGVTFGAFSLDGEYSRIVDPNKNTLTPNNASDVETAGEGFLALASYKITEPLQIGARYERVKNDPTGISVGKDEDFGGSIHYRLTSELELRGEYIAYRYNSLANGLWKDSRTSVGAVVTF